MFDVSKVQKRYFDIRLAVEDESGEVHNVDLKVEPPKLKKLRQLMSLENAKTSEAIDDLRDAVRDILSKNKDGYKVPDEYVDELNLDQLMAIIEAYMNWVGEQKAKN